MQNKAFSSLLIVTAVASAFALGLHAKIATPTIAPVLKVDRTPVSEGKAPLVASYADVVEPVQKAVVSIYSTKIVHQQVSVNPLLSQLFPNQIPSVDRESKEEGLGSGVIISGDGYILTNNHVIEGADSLTVMLSDDRRFTAKVIGSDQKTDIAVVKIEATSLPSVTLADSDRLRVGDIVFAVGNPLGVGETVTMGIVSAKGRNQLGLLEEGGYENFIQTDASINMGNSGGALVDAKGRLIGINCAIISPSRGNIGIGFAVPINLAASVMNSLVSTGTVTRGYLGISSQPLTPDIADQLGLAKETKGVIVADITPGSPAEKAGFKSSDVVLSVDGKPISSSEELRLIVAETTPNTKISLGVFRNGKPLTVDVTLGVLAEKPNELLPGVTVERLTDELRRKLAIDRRVNGLIITAIDKNSPYADHLAPNMVIMEINRNAVTDVAAAKTLLVQPGRNLFFIFYQGAPGFLVVTTK